MSLDRFGAGLSLFAVFILGYTLHGAYSGWDPYRTYAGLSLLAASLFGLYFYIETERDPEFREHFRENFGGNS